MYKIAELKANANVKQATGEAEATRLRSLGEARKALASSFLIGCWHRSKIWRIDCLGCLCLARAQPDFLSP
jgi:uncharacterized membrane protein YqiK